MSRSERVAEAIAALFEERSPDGKYRFSKSDLEALVPALVLGGSAAEPLGPEAAALLGRWAQQVGLDTGASRERIQAALTRHYREHPLNPALLARVQAILRDAVQAGGAEGKSAQAAAHLLGISPARLDPAAREPPVGRGPRPKR